MKHVASLKVNNKFWKTKGVNENVVVDELNYKDYKIFLLNRSYMRHEMNRTQSKDRNIRSCRINQILLSSYNDPKYMLDTVAYHIFLNLPINHIVIISSKIDNLS